jgi:ABC-2 type transport system permease protein
MLAVYAFFGVLGPVSTRYAQTIVEKLGAKGTDIRLPVPTPSLAIDSYVKNANQIGLILFVVMAAYALSFDARPTASSFYRTRVRTARQLLAPRVAVPFAVGALSFAAGYAVAWVSTAILISGPSVVPMLEGLLLEVVYLFFAVSVVALAAMLVRTQIATVMVSLATLVAVPIMGLVRGVQPWLPSELAGSPGRLIDGTAAMSDLWRAILVTAVALAAMLWWAAVRCARREV